MTMPDPEYGVREFLRGYDPLFAGAVHVGVPERTPLPYIVIVGRVGGGEDTSEAPLDDALIQVDAWALTRAEAHRWKSLMREAFLSIRQPLQVKDDTVIMGAVVNSDVWLPDPSDDTPRYALTVEVICRAP